jgi:hypothetical protein
MKKPIRHDHARSSSSRRSSPTYRGQDESLRRWAFNLASESLFPLGSTEQARRVAYRTANGELRFLPL